jgi:hypothetical protein
LEGKIGQEHALFYEAYGTCLELRRNFTKAKQIYELGVSRYKHRIISPALLLQLEFNKLCIKK